MASSSPPAYTRVALIPGRSEDTLYFLSGFDAAETIRLARNILKICSAYFCWVFFVGALNICNALRNGDRDDQLSAGWNFTWNLFGAWLLLHLGVQGIKTRNAPLCCCGYLNWFLGWMYIIFFCEALNLLLGIWIVADQPNLPYGCDSWKGKTHLENTTTVINGTTVNGTNPVPNQKGPKDVDCIKDTPFALCIMAFAVITLIIVTKAICRTRAFLRHIYTAEPSETTTIINSDVAPPTYTVVAGAPTKSQDAPLLGKAPPYSV